MTEYLISVMLFLIGLYAVSVKKHLIKKIMGLVIMEYSACVLIALFASRNDVVQVNVQYIISAVLVSGIGGTLMLAAVAVRLYQRHGTFDTGKIRSLRG